MPKVVLKDHYLVLGAERDATTDELKKLYHKRAREVHPDFLGPDASEEDKKEAHELAAELTVAYDQLTNQQTREAIDAWLLKQQKRDDERYSATYRQPTEVPPAGQHDLNGIWCWIEFRASGWSRTLRAVVTIQLADLFRVTDLGDLPHEAWLEEVIAVDEKGDVVGRSWSFMSLRYDIRRLQAEARRNNDRRAWRAQLAKLGDQLEQLATQGKPVDHLLTLSFKARTAVDSGIDSFQRSQDRDTVVRAIREFEKALEQVATADPADTLLADLLSGAIRHPDLDYNKRLLQKLSVYAFRSGGQYTAPTTEELQAHYRQQLAGLTTHNEVYRTDLKLPDDEAVILELAKEGAFELAPDTVEVQGNRNLTPHAVQYGYAKVNDELVPAGIIVITEAAYKRGGTHYGRTSKFPTLPYGIVLLIRVRVKVQGNEAVTDPYPDGKALENEVKRCQARLRNPKEIEPSYGTLVFLNSWPSF